MMSRPFFQKPFKYKFFYATLYIIFINIFVFLLTSRFPKIKMYLSLNPILFTDYRMIWQPLTYLFVHADFSHLFFNMFALLVFGMQLEKTIGSKEFLLFYFVSGLISGLLSFGVYKFVGADRVFLMGASGAIYALLFAYAVVFPRNRIYIWGLIPVPAPILVLIYAIIEITSELTGRNGGTAHLAHLFGFFAAFLYFIIRMRINPFKVWKNC